MNTEINTVPMKSFDWYLIQVGGATAKGYYIINSESLVAGQKNTPIGSKVKFAYNGVIRIGSLISSSQDRDVLQMEKEKLEGKHVEPYQWFVVQYSNAAGNFIHKVFNNTEIVREVVDGSGRAEVFIVDEDVQHLGKVLNVSNSETAAMEQLQQLKTNLIGVNSNEKSDPNMFIWLLVQYTATDKSIHYAVINCSETIWRSQDLYKDVVGYLCDPYHIIIRKSLDREVLHRELQEIKELCLHMQFPLQILDWSAQIAEGSDSDEELTEEEFAEQMETLQRLEKIEKRIQAEAKQISDAFKSLDAIQKGMDHQIQQLDYMLY